MKTSSPNPFENWLDHRLSQLLITVSGEIEGHEGDLVIMPLVPKFPVHWLSLTDNKKGKPMKEKTKQNEEHLGSIYLALGPRFHS